MNFYMNFVLQNVKPFCLNRNGILRQIYVNAVGICEGHCIINGPATIALSCFFSGGGWGLRVVRTWPDSFLGNSAFSVSTEYENKHLLKTGVSSTFKSGRV